MGDGATRVLAISLLLGLAGTFVGGYECVEGNDYAVAARHEETTIGQITEVTYGKGGPHFHYVFSLNGVRLGDYSEVCATPLKPGACNNNGPVKVYYAFEPFQNSRLEDFAVASAREYRGGKPTFAIGILLSVLASAGFVVGSRFNRAHGSSEPEDTRGRSGSDDVPDALHITPDD